ncbi:MAG TPA: helix-turn-helix domain-containing protein, partial [Micromonosporaceae bacterium]|nr:helix-turn-helix domain-containing protein [Micromonosporaceae bacterium]
PSPTSPSSRPARRGRSASTLDAICRELDCQPGDLLTHVPDDASGHARPTRRCAHPAEKASTLFNSADGAVVPARQVLLEDAPVAANHRDGLALARPSLDPLPKDLVGRLLELADTLAARRAARPGTPAGPVGRRPGGAAPSE